MTAAKAMIGVIEDDPALQELLVEELEAEGYKVTAWGSIEAFKKSVTPLDLVIRRYSLTGVVRLVFTGKFKK